MKKKILMLSCCLFVLLTTACGNPKLKDGKEVVASVKGKDITAEELYDQMKENYGQSELLNMIDNYIADQEVETTDEIKAEAQDEVDYWKAYAEAYSMDVVEFAQQNGLNVNSEDEFLENRISYIKLNKAIENWVSAQLKEDELKKYYDENYSEKITARHILIEIEDSDKDGSKALAQAKDIIKELKETDKDKLEDKFIELAKEWSDDGSYSEGGLLDPFMSSDVVKEFWDGASKLKDGEFTTTPVKSTYGYHIIYRKSSEDKPTYEKSKDEIKEALTAQKLDEDPYLQYDAMVALRKKYKLSIKDSVISKDYDEFLKQLEEAKSSNSNSNSNN